MDRVRLGFIGCGGQASLLQANLPMVEAIDFVAACDLDEAKATRNARRFGATSVYTDFREMIATERLDAVAICGPPQMHHELGLTCLELGCHVFLEKPPALTTDETKELVDAAEAAGKTGMVATHWRHAPAHQMARQLAEEPEFGDVMGFRCTYAAPGPRGPMCEWGIDSTVRSFLLVQAIHPVDCMRFLVGREASQVFAAIAEGSCGATSYAVTFRFHGGAVGTMNLFGGVPALLMETAITGSDGRCVEVVEAEHLTYYREKPALGQGGYQDTPALTWRQGNLDRSYGRPGYLQELQHFAAALLAGEPPRSSLADSLANMRILEAIIESNASGAPVALSR